MPLLPFADPENFNAGYVMRSQHLLCPSGATASRGPTCSSSSRSATSCPRRTSTTGPSSTAEPGRRVHYGGMVRSAPRHDRDAGGPADVLAAKAALRDEVWSAMQAAKVARFPGAPGRIPNFTGAERAAERLRGLPAWQAALTVKANPDSAQLPVRQRALEDGKTVYMAVPRLAETGAVLRPGPRPPRPAAAQGRVDQRRDTVRAAGDAGRADPGRPGRDGLRRGRRGRGAARQGRRLRRP